jgi:hypothetical protein
VQTFDISADIHFNYIFRVIPLSDIKYDVHYLHSAICHFLQVSINSKALLVAEDLDLPDGIKLKQELKVQLRNGGPVSYAYEVICLFFLFFKYLQKSKNYLLNQNGLDESKGLISGYIHLGEGRL